MAAGLPVSKLLIKSNSKFKGSYFCVSFCELSIIFFHSNELELQKGKKRWAGRERYISIDIDSVILVRILAFFQECQLYGVVYLGLY